MVTGGAGVGKSFLMRALVQYCKENNLRFAKTATTGVAAHLIGGVTAHVYTASDLEFNSNLEKGTHQGRIVEGTDVVFTDEVSMMRQEMLELFDQQVRQ